MPSSPQFDRAVREILDRVSLVQIVSEYVQLKKQGRTHLGLCPFHAEKTPSFNVNDEKRVFFCFGCQTGGNAITFLKLAAGLSGREALRRLSEVAGVPLPEDGPHDPAEEAAARARADAVHANAAGQECFRAALAGPGGAAARAYLASRGVDDDVAERFGLGFGGTGGELVAFLDRHKVPSRHAEAAGLLTRSGAGAHERFRGRLTCPVHDLDGAVIGFSARLIPPEEDGPKYVNSPESPVFRKGDALFGLMVARKAIRQKKVTVLVEGNFDVIALSAAGIENVVAPMGTALTPVQLRMLRRFAEDVVVMFDGDEAGRKASRRAVAMLVEAGLEGRIVALPATEDPDTLVRSQGAAAVEDAIKRARPMITWLLESLLELHGRTPHGMSRVIEDVREVFALERDSFRHGRYREELARVLGVEPGAVRHSLRDPTAIAPGELAAAAWPSGEQRLIELLLHHPRLVARWLEDKCDPAWLTRTESRDLLSELIGLGLGAEGDVADAFVSRTDGPGGALRAEVIRSLATPQKYQADAIDAAFDETVASLRKDALDRERLRVAQDLAAANARGDSEEGFRLLGDLKALKDQMRVLAARRA
jgi:DNA primase